MAWDVEVRVNIFEIENGLYKIKETENIKVSNPILPGQELSNTQFTRSLFGISKKFVTYELSYTDNLSNFKDKVVFYYRLPTETQITNNINNALGLMITSEEEMQRLKKQLKL